MIDRTFIEKIVELSDPTPVVIGDITYAREGFRRIAPPRAEAVKVFTLASLATYVNGNPDTIADSICHIVGPDEVGLYSPLHAKHRTRESYLMAEPILRPFEFDRFHGLQDFIIQLQTRFVPTPESADLLKIVGNLTDSSVKQYGDDGVSQSVTAKTGIARVVDVALPPRIPLVPYRTFPEIAQPPSEFVLRMQQGRDGAQPCVGLFEADGGAWKVECIRRIGEYLSDNLPDTVTILA